jgi:hypothetical protein
MIMLDIGHYIEQLIFSCHPECMILPMCKKDIRKPVEIMLCFQKFTQMCESVETNHTIFSKMEDVRYSDGSHYSRV